MKYYIILYTSMLLTAGAQIMLKLGARNLKSSPSFLQRYTKPWVITGLFAMIASMLMNVKGLRYIPLKDMTFILPTIYIAVPFFARIFLGERIGSKTMLGSLIMLIGIVIFNLPF